MEKWDWDGQKYRAMLRNSLEFELGWSQGKILWSLESFSEDLSSTNKVHMPVNFLTLLFLSHVYIILRNANPLELQM